MSPAPQADQGDGTAGLAWLPLLAMAAMALRLAERGEAWLDRSWWLVGLAGLGGFGGACAVLALRPRLPRFRRIFWHLIATGMIFAAGLLLAMMLGYIIYTLVLDGQFEAQPDRYLRAFAFAALQTGALFLISIPTYLLPWPLPFLAGSATWLLARPPGPKPVEPARREV